MDASDEDDGGDDGGDDEGEDEGPKRQRTEHVPLGIRKPSRPDFDPSRFRRLQMEKDEERESELLRRVEDEALEPPEVHQDYDVRDGDTHDRHLEGVSSVNALKELIAQAKEELEEELETTIKPFSVERMDELMVLTKDAVDAEGEEAGYQRLKRALREMVEGDVRKAQDEIERRKRAYMKTSGK